MDRERRPVIFTVPGKSKEYLKEFTKFLNRQGGDANNVLEVVCDMSPSFIVAAREQFSNMVITIDLFHAVQLFYRFHGYYASQEAKSEAIPREHDP